MVIEGAPDDDPDLPPRTWPGPFVTSQLSDRDLADLGALVAETTAADGVAPLSEHALLHLRTDAGAHARHLVVRAPDLGGAVDPADDGGFTGSSDPAAGLDAVAHVDLAGASDHATAEIVVRPGRRRQGLGSALLAAAAELAGGSPLRVWAHGHLPAAHGFSHAHGYARVRELWQMSRPLTDPLPDAPLPAGFTLRAFRPGQDDDAWLAVNAAAFAHHAEQGAWEVADLQQRMAEPWFDPAGFLLLVDDATGELAGFHWTKVHAADERGVGSGAGEDAGDVHRNSAGHDAAGGGGVGAGGRNAGDDPAAGAGTARVGAGVGGTADDGRVGEVYVVGVAPGYQGRGLAKPLTLAGLQHLRGQGLARVILYVDGDNEAAIRTYSGLGFTRRTLDVQYARQLLP
jgi:mycothiol synthase